MHRIMIVFALAAVVLLIVFNAAQRHADDATIPRLCADQVNVLIRVKSILTNKRPIREGSKRPYIIAAKLIFLVPQNENETIETYMARLDAHLNQTCRARGIIR